MNRAERRRRAKELGTPQKLDNLQSQLRWAIRKECQEEADKRIENFIRCYTTIFIYLLWYKFGIGRKRMNMFVSEIEKHLDIISEPKKYGLTIEDMATVLRDEAKIDLRFLDDGNKIDRKG